MRGRALIDWVLPPIFKNNDEEDNKKETEKSLNLILSFTSSMTQTCFLMSLSFSFSVKK